jgi:3',5'-nucleoside bisphosphate phosphatase
MSTAGGRISLHTHTSYSDGGDMPVQLVEKAAQHGLRRFASTDYDTLVRLPAAQWAGLIYGVEMLAGVELSVQYQER